jgi:hypothetical protein
MRSPLVFFSFITLEDAAPADHRRYNEWHQLDHRPENLALPGVAWGDRWGRPLGYRSAAEATPEHSATDYVAMYWFNEPVEQSVAEWDQLGADSFQWGRGPLLPGVRRNLLAFFKPVKGYASPGALVAPGVIPYRPNRGLHLTLTRHSHPFGADTHDRYRWEDRTLIPALLDVPGVAGAWTFTFSHHQRHASLPLSAETPDPPGSLRIRLLYLDDDPEATSARIDERSAETEAKGQGGTGSAGATLLRTPLRTIVPWQDW